MISSVSSINFRGDKAAHSDLINAPGRFSNAPAHQAPKADTFEDSEKENKHSALKVLGSIAGIAALAWIGLGIAVGRKGSSWKKITVDEGQSLKKMEKVKNFFYSIGESANNAYKKVFKKSAESKAKTEIK